MIFERFLKTLFCLCILSTVRSQDFSNKGTEFWVGYGYHQVMTNGLSTQNAQDMVLYFTSDVAATVTVEISSVGWVKTYQVSANNVTESDPIPKAGAQDARLLLEGVYKSGIHITSTQPIVAYAHIFDRSVSGATLLFPVSTLGQDYFSVNFTQRSNQPNSNSWAYVVATEDNSNVEITPSGNTLSHVVGQPFTVTLNKGEIYNLMGATTGNDGVDLTGTRIRSVSSGASACKKIAVFSGSGRLAINCDNSITTSDNTIQQAFPRSAWGKKYLTVPTSGLPNNYFRIIVSDPATVVSIDGVPATNLVNNLYYQILANTPKSIVADKPVMVAQYITSTNDQVPTCGNSFNSNGDPEMIYLSPVEQTIDKITLNSTDHYQITSHFINVVLKSSAASSFTIDGSRPASPFAAHPGDPAYSYLVLKVGKGNHTLKADSGFNAIAYGYGGTESYGYNAGTNIKDLYQFITLRNQYATVNFPATCKDTRFYFYLTLPFKASALTWDFGQNVPVTPNQVISQNNPVPDSSFNRDGKTLYVYSLPSLYSYTAVGTYPVKITANNQTSDGCGGVEEILYDLQVVEAPVSNFTFNNGGCVTDSVFFNNTSNANGRTLEKWLWQFGDGTASNEANPHKKFANAGSYEVKATAVNDIGCASEAAKTLTIGPKPVADFVFTNAACETNPVTFTDRSTIAQGKIAKWTWDFGDGAKQTNTNGNPLTRIFKTAGNYLVSLVVENDNGCKSDTLRQAITIGAMPVANFVLHPVCVNDPFAAFTDSSFMPGSSQGILTYKWDFGDPNATVGNPNTTTTQNPRHKYSVAGNYNVTLEVSSNTGCTATATKPFVVNGGTPQADFSLVDNGLICGNATVVGVRSNAYVDVGTISRVDLIWDVDNNPATVETDSSTAPGKIYYHTFPAANTPKTYRVKCIAYTGVNCAAEKIISVTISPLPVVTFSTIAPICIDAGTKTITEAKESTGIPGTFLYSGNGITGSGIFDPAVAGPGSTMLTYVFTSSAGCKDTATQSIVVVPNPGVRFDSPVYNLEGGSVVLNPSITGVVTKYLWSPGTYLNNPLSKNPESAASDSITYQLTVTTPEGCKGTGKVTVLILKNLSIPNAFSPNGDGINDSWSIPLLQSYANGIVEVFNRYGAVVFHSTGYSKPWAGTYNGTSLPAGVYYYIIDLKNGKKPYTGYVTILK